MSTNVVEVTTKRDGSIGRSVILTAGYGTGIGSDTWSVSIEVLRGGKPVRMALEIEPQALRSMSGAKLADLIERMIMGKSTYITRWHKFRPEAAG